MLALPHPNDLSRSVMFHKEVLGLCQASSEDGQGQGPKQLFAVGRGDNGDDIVRNAEVDDLCHMRSNNHIPVSPNGEFVLLPTPTSLEDESAYCTLSMDIGKGKAWVSSALTAVFCGFPGSTQRQSSEVMSAA